MRGPRLIALIAATGAASLLAACGEPRRRGEQPRTGADGPIAPRDAAAGVDMTAPDAPAAEATTVLVDASNTTDTADAADPVDADTTPITYQDFSRLRAQALCGKDACFPLWGERYRDRAECEAANALAAKTLSALAAGRLRLREAAARACLDVLGRTCDRQAIGDKCDLGLIFRGTAAINDSCTFRAEGCIGDECARPALSECAQGVCDIEASRCTGKCVAMAFSGASCAGKPWLCNAAATFCDETKQLCVPHLNYGQPCSEFSSSEICEFTGKCLRDPLSRAHRCEEPGRLGQPCDYDLFGCGPGLACFQNTCRALGAGGASCDRRAVHRPGDFAGDYQYACQAGLNCLVTAGTEGVCRAPGGPGAVCGEPEDCALPNVCRRAAVADGPGTCGPPRAEGEFCTHDRECAQDGARGNRCYRSRCAPFPAEGQACEGYGPATFCPPGTTCTGLANALRCVPLRKLGEACTLDDCAAGLRCSSNTGRVVYDVNPPANRCVPLDEPWPCPMPGRCLRGTICAEDRMCRVCPP